MNKEASPVPVKILGKEYRIACTEDEHSELLASAQYLDQKMREIRDSGKIAGIDKIAIMAALNIAHEMTQIQSTNQYLSETLAERLENLGHKIDSVVENSGDPT